MVLSYTIDMRTEYLIGFRTIVLSCFWIFLLSCSSIETKHDQTPGANLPTDEEISLKKDRVELDEIRKDIPAEVRETNDEWALILKDMDGERSPYEIRSRFYEKVRRHREHFNEDMRKAREQFNKSEQRQRKAMLKILDDERKDFERSKKTTDKRKAFFEDHADRRKIFFEEERDKRKDFESQVTQKRKDFEEYMKDRQKQFDDAIREYTKNFEEKKKEKRALENAKLEAQRRYPKQEPSANPQPAQTAPQYPGQEQDLRDIKNTPTGKPQPLVPDEE